MEATKEGTKKKRTKKPSNNSNVVTKKRIKKPSDGGEAATKKTTTTATKGGTTTTTTKGGTKKATKKRPNNGETKQATTKENSTQKKKKKPVPRDKSTMEQPAQTNHTKQKTSSEKATKDDGTPKKSVIKLLPREERVDIFSDAAKVGQLTRMNEYVVEQVAGPKEEEAQLELGRSAAASAIETSDFQIAIQEAAEMGKMRRLKPVVIENSREREKSNVELFIRKKDMSRIAQFLEEEKKRKVVETPMERAERIRKAMENVNLLSPTPIKAPKNVRRNIPFRMREDVAKLAAKESSDRMARMLDTETDLKVTFQCQCPHCKNASPFQTSFYSKLSKERLKRVQSQRFDTATSPRGVKKVLPKLEIVEEDEVVDEKLAKTRKQVEASIRADEERRKAEAEKQANADKHANIQAAKATLEQFLFQQIPKADETEKVERRLPDSDNIDPDVMYSTNFGIAATRFSKREIEESLDEDELYLRQLEEEIEQEDLRQLTELYERQDAGEKVDGERIYELELFDRYRRGGYLSQQEQRDLDIYRKRRIRTDRFIEEYQEVMYRYNQGEVIDEHRAYQLEYVAKKRGLSQDLTMNELSAMILFETEEYVRDGLDPADFITSYSAEAAHSGVWGNSPVEDQDPQVSETLPAAPPLSESSEIADITESDKSDDQDDLPMEDQNSQTNEILPTDTAASDATSEMAEVIDSDETGGFGGSFAEDKTPEVVDTPPVARSSSDFPSETVTTSSEHDINDKVPDVTKDGSRDGSGYGQTDPYYDSSLSSFELDELERLIDLQEDGEDIDEDRLRDLDLFDRWRYGETLSDDEMKHVDAFRKKRRRERAYRKEFEELVELQEEGEEVDQERFYHLQLYARREIGESMTEEELLDLEDFETKEEMGSTGSLGETSGGDPTAGFVARATVAPDPRDIDDRESDHREGVHEDDFDHIENSNLFLAEESIGNLPSKVSETSSTIEQIEKRDSTSGGTKTEADSKSNENQASGSKDSRRENISGFAEIESLPPATNGKKEEDRQDHNNSSDSDEYAGGMEWGNLFESNDGSGTPTFPISTSEKDAGTKISLNLGFDPPAGMNGSGDKEDHRDAFASEMFSTEEWGDAFVSQKEAPGPSKKTETFETEEWGNVFESKSPTSSNNSGPPPDAASTSKDSESSASAEALSNTELISPRTGAMETDGNDDAPGGSLDSGEDAETSKGKDRPQTSLWGHLVESRSPASSNNNGPPPAEDMFLTEERRPFMSQGSASSNNSGPPSAAASTSKEDSSSGSAEMLSKTELFPPRTGAMKSMGKDGHRGGSFDSAGQNVKNSKGNGMFPTEEWGNPFVSQGLASSSNSGPSDAASTNNSEISGSIEMRSNDGFISPTPTNVLKSEGSDDFDSGETSKRNEEFPTEEWGNPFMLQGGPPSSNNSGPPSTAGSTNKDSESSGSVEMRSNDGFSPPPTGVLKSEGSDDHLGDSFDSVENTETSKRNDKFPTEEWGNPFMSQDGPASSNISGPPAASSTSKDSESSGSVEMRSNDGFISPPTRVLKSEGNDDIRGGSFGSAEDAETSKGKDRSQTSEKGDLFQSQSPSSNESPLPSVAASTSRDSVEMRSNTGFVSPPTDAIKPVGKDDHRDSFDTTEEAEASKGKDRAQTPERGDLFESRSPVSSNESALPSAAASTRGGSQSDGSMKKRWNYEFVPPVSEKEQAGNENVEDKNSNLETSSSLQKTGVPPSISISTSSGSDGNGFTEIPSNRNDHVEDKFEFDPENPEKDLDETNNSSLLSPEEMEELQQLLRRKALGQEVDEEHLFQLQLLDQWHQSGELTPSEQRDLEVLRKERRKARRYMAEFQELLERSDREEAVEEERLYFLQLFARRHVGEELTAEEMLDLQGFEEEEMATACELNDKSRSRMEIQALGPNPSRSHDDSSAGGQGSFVDADLRYVVVADDAKSLLSAGEVIELEELLEHQALGQAIDNSRLDCLQLIYRWGRGEALDVSEREHLSQLRQQRRKDRYYKNEFEELLETQGRGVEVDEDRIYFLQLYARRLLGEYLSFTELLHLEESERKESLLFGKEEVISRDFVSKEMTNDQSLASMNGESGEAEAARSEEARNSGAKQSAMPEESLPQLTGNSHSRALPTDDTINSKKQAVLSNSSTSSETPEASSQNHSQVECGSLIDGIDEGRSTASVERPFGEPGDEETCEEIIHGQVENGPVRHAIDEVRSTPSDGKSFDEEGGEDHSFLSEIDAGLLQGSGSESESEEEDSASCTSVSHAEGHQTEEQQPYLDVQMDDYMGKRNDSNLEKNDLASQVPNDSISSLSQTRADIQNEKTPQCTASLPHIETQEEEPPPQSPQATPSEGMPRTSLNIAQSEIRNPTNSNSSDGNDMPTFGVSEGEIQTHYETPRNEIRASLLQFQSEISSKQKPWHTSESVQRLSPELSRDVTSMLPFPPETTDMKKEDGDGGSIMAQASLLSSIQATESTDSYGFNELAKETAQNMRNQKVQHSNHMAVVEEGELMKELQEAKKAAQAAEARLREEAAKRLAAEERAKKAQEEARVAREAAFAKVAKESNGQARQETPNTATRGEIEKKRNCHLSTDANSEGYSSYGNNTVDTAETVVSTEAANVPRTQNVNEVKDYEQRAQDRRERARRAVEERRRRAAEQAKLKTAMDQAELERRERTRKAVEERKRKAREAMEARKAKTYEIAMEKMKSSSQVSIPANTSPDSLIQGIKQRASEVVLSVVMGDPPIHSSDDPPGLQYSPAFRSNTANASLKQGGTHDNENELDELAVVQKSVSGDSATKEDDKNEDFTHEDWYSKLEKIARSQTYAEEFGGDPVDMGNRRMSQNDWYKEIEALSKSASASSGTAEGDDDMKRAIEEAQRNAEVANVAINGEGGGENDEEMKHEIEEIRRNIRRMTKTETVNQILQKVSTDSWCHSSADAQSRGDSSAFPDLSSVPPEDIAYSMASLSEGTAASGGFELRSHQTTVQNEEDRSNYIDMSAIQGKSSTAQHSNNGNNAAKSQSKSAPTKKKEKNLVAKHNTPAKRNPVEMKKRPNRMQNISWRSDPKDSFSDWRVEITVKETGTIEVYYLHRNVLGYGVRKSEYFSRQFQEDRVVNGYYETKSPQVTKLVLPKAWANLFPLVLDFLYYNRDTKFKVTADRACALFKWAEFLEIAALMNTVAEFYGKHISLKNFDRFMTSAVQMKAGRLVLAAKSKIGNLVTAQPQLAWRIAPQFLVSVLETNRKELIAKARFKDAKIKPQAFQRASFRWSKAIYNCVRKNKRESNRRIFEDLTTETALPVIDPSVALQLLSMDVDFRGDSVYSPFQKRCVESILQNWESFRSRYPSQEKMTAALQKLPSDVLAEILILSNRNKSNPQTAI